MRPWAGERARDAAVGGLLFGLACVIFREAVVDPGVIPAGVDLLQHYSRESVFRRALSAGTMPWWNPYEFSGFPLQADPQVGAFYPPSIVLRVLPLPAFLTWTIVFHVWLFGIGAYALCRAFGVGRPQSAIAAAALMLSGAVIPRVYAGHFDVLRTIAWIPLALAASVRSLDRRSGTPSPAAVLALACLVLGSHVQFVAYAIASIGLYALFSIFWPADGRVSRQHLAAIGREYVLLLILVAGLTAVQMVPAARLAAAGGRIGAMSYEAASQPAFGWPEFVRFITPFADESATHEAWETSAYVGVLLAVLAPFALFLRSRRRTVCFLALLAGMSLAFASGGALYELHYSVLPMFRIPARFLVFWTIAVASLGALALDSITRAAAVRRAAERWRWRRWIPGAVLLGVAGALVVIETTARARSFVQPRRFEDRFAARLPFSPTPGGRVLSMCEGRIHALELAAVGAPTVDGYNSYYLSDYARLILSAREEDTGTVTSAGARLGSGTNVPATSTLNLLNVTEILSCVPLERDDLRHLGEWGPVHVYQRVGADGRVRAVPLGEEGCDSAEAVLDQDAPIFSRAARIEGLIADRPDGRLRFVFSAPQPHLLLLAEPFYAERRARVDGRETMLYRANIGLSAICVGPGEHVVEIDYEPESFRWGAAISAMTLTLWVGVPYARRRITRR